jgi:hypothetical protein
LSTSPFPCTQSIKRIERSEMQVVLLHSFQNVLKAVLGHRKARRVTSTSSGLKRLKTQNTMSEKRKGDTLKGIPKSIHKRELILDEEEFDASSSGGGEEILYFVFFQVFLYSFAYIHTYSSLYIITYLHLSSVVNYYNRNFCVHLWYDFIEVIVCKECTKNI